MFSKISPIYLIGILIVVLILVSVGIGQATKLGMGFTVISTGIISFVGMLLLTYTLSKSKTLDSGEMRKSITAALLSVFIALSVLSIFPPANMSLEMGRIVTEHLTYLLGIVIVFYFGSSTLRDYLQSKKK